MAPPTDTELASISMEVRWRRAYGQFKQRNQELAICLESEWGDDTQSPESLSPTKLKELVDRKVEERDAKKWIFKLRDKPVKLRESAEKIVRFVLWTKDLVGAAVATSPYASLAWSGIALVLPLVLNTSEQNDSMTAGLLKVTEMLQLYRIRDELYLDENSSSDERWKNFDDTVVALYSSILEYQAQMIFHLSQRSLSRARRGILKSIPWSDWLARIEELDLQCSRFSELLDRTRDESHRRQILKLTETSNDIQTRILDWYTSSLQGQRNVRRDDQEEKILQSFASAYETDKNTRKKPVKDTCQWFVDTPKFQDWRDEVHSSLLWLSAGPGCGKSVMCRFLIDGNHLLRTITGSHVFYFFFRDGQDDCRNATNALTALLHQIFALHSNRDLIRHALDAYRSFGDKLKSNLDRLWDILVAIANDPDSGEIVCVLDALDECKESTRHQLISKLVDFYEETKKSQSNLKFFITSRRYDTISDGFSPLEQIARYINIDGNNYAQQISKDIDTVLEHETAYIFSKSPRTTQQRILQRLKSVENRTYLWLYLTLENLSPHKFAKGAMIETLLDNLPTELEEQYEAMLGSIQDRDTAITILKMIVAAVRPLYLSEINLMQALYDMNAVTEISDEDELEIWRDEDIRSNVENACGLFVQVYESQIYLLHQTAREYLVGTIPGQSSSNSWKGALNMPEAHNSMAQVCMCCISLGAPERLSDLLPYAAEYWTDHWNESETSWRNFNTHEMMTLLTAALSNWLFGSRNFLLKSSYTPLHIASYFGLDEAVRNELLTGQDPDQIANDNTPLSFAAERGALAVVETLIKAGADPNNAVYEQFGSPLYIASSMGLLDIVKFLTENGADVNLDFGRTPALCTAAEYNHLTIAEYLLSRGANVNAKDKRLGYTALHEISALSDLSMAKCLINHGANINQRDERGRTPLHAACRGNNFVLAKYLLDHGAHINERDETGVNALGFACGSADWTLVKFLLDHNADTDQIGNSGDVLFRAAYEGRTSNVKFMIDHGADVNRENEYGDNALQGASLGGHLELVKYLVASGAEPDLVTWRGTALQGASSVGHLDVVEYLVDHGADVHLKGSTGGPPLHLASANGHLEVVEFLVEHGADVNEDDEKGRTPLQRASRWGELNTVRYLVEHGAHINRRDNKGRTALHRASSDGHLQVVKYLVNHGADLHLRNHLGETALQMAESEGCEEIVNFLEGVDRQQSILVRDAGRTSTKAPKSTSTDSNGAAQEQMSDTQNPAGAQREDDASL